MTSTALLRNERSSHEFVADENAPATRLLFMLTGLVWVVPSKQVPEGTWLFGVAAILIGINVVRYLKQVAA